MNMNSTLSKSDIYGLEQDVLAILKKIETKKYKIQNSDFRQLTNHLQYCLTTIRNISQTLAVEKADPYNSVQADYTSTSLLTGKKIQYMPDGSVRVVDPKQFNTTGDGWENQFDESMLLKPPCFQSPPQNLTNISNIRNATEWNRIKNASGDPTGIQRL